MSTTKPTLSKTSSKTSSLTTGRVVGLPIKNLSDSPSTHTNQTADNTGGKSQPPQGFDGPVPDGLSGKLPQRATAESVTSSNDDRQVAVNEKLGLVDKTSAIDALLGRGGDQGQDGGHPLTDLTGSARADKPGFDQGFNKSPDSSALAASAAALSGNPMKAFEGGSVGGLLGELASSQAKGLSDFDKSDLVAGFWEDLKEGWKALTERQPKEGTTNGSSADQLNEIEKENKPNPAPTPVMPDPENTGVKVNFLSQSILNQLKIAQTGKPTSQGGSGDATPVDDGGIGSVGRDGSIAPNQSSINGRNLLGQPVGPAGEQTTRGGNKGLDVFGNSNGAGVINPGPDGGTPQGDARFAEDPGSALGGRQPSPNLGGGRDAGRQDGSSSSSANDLVLNGTTGADTLRGFGGNDTLIGLAGNDSLDGGTGRDQLTGGAGADRFRFSAGSGFGQANADRITDFNRAEGDRIEISRQAFGLAAGTSVSFQSVNTDQALSQALASGSLFVHDQRNGSLLFNQNGTAAGFGSGGVFATLLTGGTALQASDLALIA